MMRAMPAGETTRKSAVRSGIQTAVSMLAISGSAALAGALLAQKFGRGADTDGFMAAYGIYLVLVLGAQAVRVVVMPDLTRAAAKGELGREVRGYVLSFLALAVPAVTIAVVLSRPLGDLLTGSPQAADIAARSLPWLLPAAFLQLLAAIATSALAARDSYGVAAVAYGLGAVAGLVVFLVLADGHGLVSLAWGLALNGAVTLGIPTVALALHHDLGHVREGGAAILARLGRLGQGAALPLALQGLYLVCLTFAAHLGVGSATSLSYAYLLAATLCSVTASALALISSAPLTRRGLDAEAAARHVVHASWLSLAVIAAAAGVFAIVGGRVVGWVLGDAYTGDVGGELGRLFVAFAPWMLVTVALTSTYALVFVMERTRFLVVVALAALVAQVPATWVFREAFGLNGIPVALALVYLGVLAALTGGVSRRMLTLTVAGVGRLAFVVGALAAVSFGAPLLVLGGFPAAGVGLALYCVLLAVARPRGLRDAFTYMRALH
jgi:O-antigen/teichoic acid export membrane protein